MYKACHKLLSELYNIYFELTQFRSLYMELMFIKYVNTSSLKSWQKIS
jgi:hypothetical protein